MTIDSVLLHGDLEHLRGGGAIDIAALGEHFLPPGLTGQPGDDTGLNRGKVGHDELIAVFRNESRADQLRERIRHILIQHFDAVIITGANESTCLCQVREMILRQVLHLDQAARPSPGTAAVELEHPTGAAICADGVHHGLILLHTGFRQLLPEDQHALQFRRSAFDELRHDFFPEAVGLHAVVGQPLFHLLDAVGIVQLCQMLHGFRQLGPGAGIHVDGLPDQRQVDHDATVIDLLVDVILVPYEVRDRKLLQAFLDGHLGFDVTDVVALKGGPLERFVFRTVTGAAIVGLRRDAGLTEELDQFFTFRELLLFQPEHRADAFQRQRQSHRGRPDHGAAPAFRIQVWG